MPTAFKFYKIMTTQIDSAINFKDKKIMDKNLGISTQACLESGPNAEKNHKESRPSASWIKEKHLQKDYNNLII